LNLIELLSLWRYLDSGSWNDAIAITCVSQFALYQHRSPIHQSHYSLLPLTKHVH